MTTTQTYPWDVTDHLQTKEDIAAYLEAALEDGDPEIVVAAIQDIIRTKRFTQLTHDIKPETLSDPLDFHHRPQGCQCVGAEATDDSRLILDFGFWILDF